MGAVLNPAARSIAVIGMACVYPGAHSPEELWHNVLAGRRFFRQTPPERLSRADYFDSDPNAPAKMYCDQVAVITDWVFDPLEFRVPPVVVEASDLTHWLALSTAATAIRDAKLDLATCDRGRMEVVVGNTLVGEFSRSHALRFRWPYVERAIRHAWNDTGYKPERLDSLLVTVRHYYETPLPEITEDTLAGNMANTIAGRICNHFDLGGGGYVIDGACSSSLLAVATACDHLVHGESELIIAGGVDISLDPFEIVGFAKVGALASDDIRPYDARAAGFLPGEGCGFVVLEREEDARAAGRKIYALIRGWGHSSDGTGGITAPEVEGQIRALRRAYERADYPISTVDLVEGHGTGTALGDKVEIKAILKLLTESPGEGDCRIGSIKANIGHCKAAAGVAGLIKAVMALNRKILPPTVNCDHPNPAFGRPMRSLRPITRGEAWEARDRPRRASVSAMGFGGSNCHITLEEANAQGKPSTDELALLGSSQRSELILLGAKTVGALASRVERLISIADSICRAEMTDLAAALAAAEPGGSIRMAIVAESPWQLAASLRQVLRCLYAKMAIEEISDPAAGILFGSPGRVRDFVALFPGQGSQYLNMGRALLRRYPFVRDLYERAEKAVREILPDGLGSVIERPVDTVDSDVHSRWEAELRDTRVAQPAIVLSSLAMLRVLEFLGLRPSVSIGHSLGEISALCAAGACDDETAVRVAALRGRAMASLDLEDPGAMAALAAPAVAVQELIRPFGKELVISNLNSPRQTVVSGASHLIAELVRVCEARGIRGRKLAVSHAFHSSIVAPAAAAFHHALASVSFQAPSRVVISTSTGAELDRDTDLRELLSEQICRPVRFADAILRACTRRPALWVEVGPGGVLTNLVSDVLGADGAESLPTELEDEDCFHLLNNILARAFVLGLPFAVDKVFAHRFCRPFALASYSPRFIVNPCERQVPPLHASPGSGPSSSTQAATTSVDVAAEAVVDYADSLLDYAVDWIAQRTGFPREYITAGTKLRDDLNLDSIKAAQLVVLLSKRLRGMVPTDPAGLANASLGQLVDSVIRQNAEDLQEDWGGEGGEMSLRSRIGSLEPWVRTFSVDKIAAPLNETPSLPLPASGFAAIIAESECPWAQAIASRLRDRGLTPIVTDARSLFRHRGALDTLAVLVIILPQVSDSFLDCTPRRSHDRIEGPATSLFMAFGWPVHWRKGGLDNLRCLVLRSAAQPDDPGADLDAGGAFLKSLQLEYPRAHLKWIRLPATWCPQRSAEVAMHEIQASDNRVMFEYCQNGVRTTRVAVPLRDLGERPSPLGADDVVVATGGAKGITSELGLELARQTGVKLALLGSSPEPDPQTSPEENEMLRSFQRLDREGIQYVYVQCDVTDSAAVRRAVARIQRGLGPITGILHGAGVSNPRQFRDLNLSSFLQCIRVKARGLYNLLSAVPPDRLKVLHVISSVLGRTGMRSQTDYALANAWLDGALESISIAHPQLQCLSLGYSLWAETGMGRKLDLLMDLLLAAGVTPISVEDGVAAYADLVRRVQTGSTFVITGRLTPELESVLFSSPGRPRGRYLERVLRWIPGVEIVAEASLSHRADFYLREHIFEGTPLFPGVMAGEAMAQAAMACAGAEDLHALRNLCFLHPLIVPEDASVVVRTVALAEPMVGNKTRVRVAMRSESDGFKENHFEAEYVFDSAMPSPDGLPPCPQLPKPLAKGPEDFSPDPLFQGKFFRRITTIHKLEWQKESITKVGIPDGARYYDDRYDQTLVTGAPAARDAFLQSGAIVLPSRYLPVQVEEIRSYQKPVPGSELICHSQVVAKSAGEFVADIAVFTQDGQLVETMNGIVLRAPTAVALAPTRRSAVPIFRSHVESALRSLLPQVPHGLAIVAHAELEDLANREKSDPAEIESLLRGVGPARQEAEIANMLAARQAVMAFAHQHRNRELLPTQASVLHRSDGKPVLQFEDLATRDAFRGIDLSLADGADVSIALVGASPVGVDIEAVETRDAETWRGLLGDDGYALALQLATELAEPFDCAATRTWTILEAGKKANSLRRVVPDYESRRDDSWISLVTELTECTLRFLSAAISEPGAPGPASAIAVALTAKTTVPPGCVQTGN